MCQKKKKRVRVIIKDAKTLSIEELIAFITYGEDVAESAVHKDIRSITIAKLNKRNIARNS